jgi:hypothetical protein
MTLAAIMLLVTVNNLYADDAITSSSIADGTNQLIDLDQNGVTVNQAISWSGSARAISDEHANVGDRQTCPADALFGQEPYPPPVPRFVTSHIDADDAPFVVAFDNFENASGLTAIRWWGIQAYEVGGNTWVPCTYDPGDFEIKFYTAGDNAPDAPIATYLVSVSATPTGLLYSEDGSEFELLEWEAVLAPPPAIGDEMAWVSIMGNASGGDPCWFRWVKSPDGDQLAYYRREGIEEYTLTTDFAFCLIGGPDYVCGDADASGGVDIDDVVYLIAFIFSGGPEPVPYDSGDANCSGGVDIDDVVWLIAYIFSGGNAPCDTDGDEVPDC